MSKDRKILIFILVIANLLIAAFCYLVLRPGPLGLTNEIFNPSFEFSEPLMLGLLALIPLLSLYYFIRLEKNSPEINFPSSGILSKLPADPKVTLRHLSFVFRILALSFLILALARPQSKQSWENSNTEGIDIVFAIDVSYSMLAKDFPTNRLHAAKKVAIDFIDQRPNDRMGLVIYEGESFTQVPLTTDHKVLKDMFVSLQPGLLESGTAVGMGLATSIKRLNDSEAKSKVIILLTDGVNNSGNIQPVDAALLAKEFGIRVYTIGIGSLGEALSPAHINPYGEITYKRVKVEIDEKSLIEIASTTGGKYFRAKNMKSLENVYEEIDQMEKTIIKVTEHRKKSEKYLYFALIGMCLLLAEFLYKHLYIRQQP
ncbi:MAG: Ca-activated chloride channel family protein [Gammaproteobacteria bacterium]